MSWLSRISLANRKLAALITIIVVAFGAYAASSLKQQLIPNISFPAVTVTATYAGASPQVVEDQVVKPIEDQLGVANGKLVDRHIIAARGIQRSAQPLHPHHLALVRLKNTLRRENEKVRIRRRFNHLIGRTEGDAVNPHLIRQWLLEDIGDLHPARRPGPSRI